jgi:hypothetical protein
MVQTTSRRRTAYVLGVVAAALALVSASSVETAPSEPLAGSSASGRAAISLAPNSVTARDIASQAIQVRHFGRSTLRQINGAGPMRLRPRATSATVGWLYFAEDADGGALFRSDGSSWTQLTTGRLGKIARNSIDSTRIAPEAISASRLANGAVTSRNMSMNAWRAISSSGVLASRPEATTRPAGSFWFAPDVQGGTLYQNDGFNWVRVTSLGAEANITPGSITSELIADGGVATVDLAAGAVDSTRILDGAVGTSKLAAGAVGASQLAAGAVGASQLAADAVGAAAIAADAVGTSEIADGSIALADIDPAVWSDRIGAGTLAGLPAAAPANADSLYFATDDAGGTQYRSDGSAWQVAGRARSPQIVNFMYGVWTNMPAALSEQFGTNRNRAAVDMSTATQVRLFTNVITVGAGSLCVHYSLDDGASWYEFDGTAGIGCPAGIAQVPINVLGLRTSAWVDIPTVARVENAQVRLVSISGNGALDPNFGVTAMALR